MLPVYERKFIMIKVFIAECASLSGKDLMFDTQIAAGFDKSAVISEAESYFNHLTASEKSDLCVSVGVYNYSGTADEFDDDLVDYAAGYEEICVIGRPSKSAAEVPPYDTWELVGWYRKNGIDYSVWFDGSNAMYSWDGVQDELYQYVEDIEEARQQLKDDSSLYTFVKVL